MTTSQTQILVVDDNPKIRTLIVSILKTAGYTDITEAENGMIAWEVLQDKQFDLVLSDVMMPEMDGIDLLKKIRSAEGTLRSTPVLLVTASDKSDDIVAAAKWKVNGYIVKPFRVKTVVAKINQVIQG